MASECQWTPLNSTANAADGPVEAQVGQPAPDVRSLMSATHRGAGGVDPHQRDQPGDRLVDQGFSVLLLAPVENCSSRAETFPWISITLRAVSSSALSRLLSLRSLAASFWSALPEPPPRAVPTPAGVPCHPARARR